ncbi:MAG TPA: alpha/beta fold hydrolase [Campylobacterales bacterium]|nr:alpha/beta fold hydrolase [Campylobacterales bacterium]
MRYFNGFALHNEEQFFQEYLIQSDFCVAGFSYGAQQALEYTYQSSERIDRLILLSPAFFQHHKTSFMRTQMRYFKADQRAYTEQFLKNVAYPSSIDLHPYLSEGTYVDLEALLHYQWHPEKFKVLQERGVIIEVFIGGADQIVEPQKSFAFFSELCPSYYVKERGHLLH